MTDLVPSDAIEQIVGVGRHDTKHWGRAISAEQTVYILHSQQCLDSGVDLRDCPYSLALDDGIDIDDWIQDVPVLLTLNERGDLEAWLFGLHDD